MSGRRHLLLYDGACGLCQRLNRFVLARDHHDKFRFAPLQGELGRAWVRRAGGDPDELATFYVVAGYEGDDPCILSRAQAGLFVLRELGGVWKAAGALRILPDRLLDRGYDLLARNRSRWFGEHAQCALPPPKYRRKFLEEA